MACHFYNATNQDCKKAFQENLRLLLEKIDGEHRQDLLKNIVLSWISDKIEHRCLAVQLFLLFIEIEREQFDQYLMEILSFIQKEFQEIEPDENEEEQNFRDQYMYHLINVLIHVIKHCPSATQLLALRSIWLQLLRLIDEKGLLPLHIWVRLLSAQVFGLFFETNKPAEIVQSLSKYQGHEGNS